jgi:hypothetical protein
VSLPQINCLRCRYYYITWDSRFPRGCRLFGFKSSGPPSLAVLQSSGESCKGFVPKTPESSEKK